MGIGDDARPFGVGSWALRPTSRGSSATITTPSPVARSGQEAATRQPMAGKEATSVLQRRDGRGNQGGHGCDGRHPPPAGSHPLTCAGQPGIPRAVRAPQRGDLLRSRRSVRSLAVPLTEGRMPDKGNQGPATWDTRMLPQPQRFLVCNTIWRDLHNQKKGEIDERTRQLDKFAQRNRYRPRPACGADRALQSHRARSFSAGRGPVRGYPHRR
jgi:hypothetical protein